LKQYAKIIFVEFKTAKTANLCPQKQKTFKKVQLKKEKRTVVFLFLGSPTVHPHTAPEFTSKSITNQIISYVKHFPKVHKLSQICRFGSNFQANGM
jgi:hypothetical protein